MSANGVFFTCRDRVDRPLNTGAQIRLAVMMEHGDPLGGPIVVRCAGAIVRVEPTPDTVGVAVLFDTYQFDMPSAVGIE